MIFLGIIIPIVGLALLYSRRTWSPAVCGLYLLAAVPVALGFNALWYFAGTRQDYYAEIWNYKVSAVRYYERWNEEVACQHPVYRTEMRTRTVNGRTETYSEQVFDHYQHPYDVDDHPEHWRALTEYGDECSINSSEYSSWKQLWQNSRWVNLHHRSVHSIDGNMYESTWPGDFARIYPWEQVNEYENRVRVSNSVFNYAPVDKATLAKYWRPADRGYTGAVLSYDGVTFTEAESMYLRRVNAYLGRSSKVHLLVLLFDSSKHSSDVMNDVLAAWRGPNKNELVIAIGVSGSRDAAWCQCFSWCDDTTIHSLIRQDVFRIGKLDLVRLGDAAMEEVPLNWHKKSFKDFNYLSNPLPTWTWILAALTSLLTAAGAGWAFVANEESITRSCRRRLSR